MEENGSLLPFFEIAGLKYDLKPPIPFEPEIPSLTAPLTVEHKELPRKAQKTPTKSATLPVRSPVESSRNPRLEIEQTDDRYSIRIRELPSEERPRERLIQIGPEALTTAELLAILIRTGTERRSAVAVAEQLLSDHGGLRGVARLSIAELSEVHGIGEAKAAQIKAAIEFGRRLVAASPEERPKIASPRDVYNLLTRATVDSYPSKTGRKVTSTASTRGCLLPLGRST